MAEKTFTVKFDEEEWGHVSKLLHLQEHSDLNHSAIMAMGAATVRFS